ncbi:high mobility group B protein 1 isoform X2 [Gossypium hirsutum]|uniref:High mobility group B protein 1 isoform X2 n=1 Tax=Gossypium hirsutum TaxID=3635 RepID=A0ABM3BFI9_GOSHI|nr:high mobility group B protein 1-like isoform X2 [Gossypium hirsutum]
MKATRGREDATMKDKKEAKKPAENKVVGKRKAASRADKSDRKRAKNIASSTNKDPNKPKRPATAFFVFMEEFRTSYKQEHPKVKAISAVGKAGGEKWKSMSNAVMHKTSNAAPPDLAMYRSNVHRLGKLLWHG